MNTFITDIAQVDTERPKSNKKLVLNDTQNMSFEANNENDNKTNLSSSMKKFIVFHKDIDSNAEASISQDMSMQLKGMFFIIMF